MMGEKPLMLYKLKVLMVLASKGKGPRLGQGEVSPSSFEGKFFYKTLIACLTPKWPETFLEAGLANQRRQCKQ